MVKATGINVPKVARNGSANMVHGSAHAISWVCQRGGGGALILDGLVAEAISLLSKSEVKQV